MCAMKNLLLLLLFSLFSHQALKAQDCGAIPATDNKVYDWCYTPNLGTNWNTAEYKPYILNGMPFRLLFPKGFDSTAVTSKKYPLVVLMHGLGMGGTDNNLPLKIGGEPHLEARNRGSYDGFVMVPQAGGENWTTAERAHVLKFIERAIQDLGVDPLRVLLEGYSAGGTAAWKLAYENPLVFAGAIIMSSADGASAKDYARVLKYTALWHAQGGRDSQPQPSTGDRVAEEFRAVGANYQYQYYPELGHGTWEAMYLEPHFFPFLMNTSMLQIHATHFKYNFCDGEAIAGTLGIRQGFEAYEWQKDGNQFGSNKHEVAFTALGTYRVRIKYKGAWSAWSEPFKVQRVAPTATPTVVATGPTALPSLDGRTSVTLRAPKGYQHYLWSDGSTLDSLVVEKAGSYHVAVTAPYGCSSAASAPVQVTFNAEEGVVAAPARLTVAADSETALTVTWEDKSGNERGFELYRSSSPEGPWSLIAQPTANSIRYQDKALNPYTRYYYAIRAVREAGGSAYVLGSGKTHADTSPPGSPGNLAARKTSRSSITLNWQAAEDIPPQAAPLTYQIFMNDSTLVATTTKTTFTVKDLPEQSFFNFRVRAIDQVENLSPFSNQVTAGTFIKGLDYTYYEGRLTTVHNISLLDAVKTGNVANFDIVSPRQVNDAFAFKFEGYINIPTTGDYTFFTTSNDGSTLSINGLQVVNNDKVHEQEEKSGTVTLSSGLHEIKVLYFEDQGPSETLQVSWEGPGISKQPIPDAAFSEAIPQQQQPAPPTAVTATAVADQSIQLSWTHASAASDADQIEIYRSTSQSGTFRIVNTVPAATAAYTDRGLVPATTYYYKLRTISQSGASDYADMDENGDWIHASTATGSLIAPAALVAYWANGNNAALKWTDQSGIESGFEVWRSTDGSNFTKIATTAANITRYTDQGLDSLSNYSYQVRAVAQGGFSEWGNIAQLTDENKPPVILNFPTRLQVPEGKESTITFDLHDPEGEALQLISRYLPEFAKIEIVSPNTGRIVLNPLVKDIGLYRGIQFTAHDGVLETDVTFSIKVLDSEKKSIYINIGNNSVAEAPWNNANTFPGQNNKVAINNLLDEFGEETGYSLTLLDAWSASKPYGETSGNHTGLYPDGVTQSAYIINPDETARLKISGLQADMYYNFVFFGSSVYKSTNGSTVYSIGSESVSLAVQSNIDKTVQINGIRADAQGEVVITVAGGADATRGGYLNALVIEAYPAGNKLLRPGRFRAHAESKSSIALSWTDNTYQETGFEIWRRTLPSGKYDLVATTGANVTDYLDTGLEANTGYEYKLRAVGNGAYSSYAEIKQAATLLYEVFVNANYTMNMGQPWVNLDQRPVTGYTWFNFRNEDMQNTGINLRLDQSFDGNNAYGPTANNQGIYHDNVIKTYYYTEIGTIAKMYLYGLDDALTYNFRFFAASAFEGGENGTTEYRIGAKKVSLDAHNNINHTAVIRNVEPTQGGVLIEVEAGDFARYGFINALEIEVRDAYQEIRGATPNTPDTGEPSPLDEMLNQITRLYPNPTQGELMMEFMAETDSRCHIEISDLSGRLLQSVGVVAQEGTNTFNLDLSTVLLNKGLYLIRVKSATFESRVKRFVKH